MNERDKTKVEEFFKSLNSSKDGKKGSPWIAVIALLFVIFNILADSGIFLIIIKYIKSMGFLTTLLIIAVAIVIISIRQINQYQRGVKFTLGRYTGIMEPGWRLIFPIIQSHQKVDMRIKAVDVPDQEAITKDNISVKVNAVIYYKVSNAEKAIIEVEDFFFAVSQLAQTTMRNVVGEVNLDELLSNRDEIAERIRLSVDKATDAWGIKVNSVELKDVTLPEEMKRVIGKQAEAEREKRSVIIKAEGEVIAAENLAKAANTLSASNGALHLRTLNTLNDLSSDQSNTVIFALPIEVLRAFEKMGGDKK
ncbi:MAG: SPFH domain / Band 7 family protein [Candidatus Moranbacteria bacterium GW2011_GWE2_35_2-]|nr:MAG: SPFH domain / Band 7 family protein [Candidatus Moranbacteria bacterium GW2011_GWE2_35_2-]KKQ22960.1 MAG: SPFH domain / Band 7 family protein [Candidatus Moranbacteria bacterium GW2011_GWF2_37_11]KKQ29318.1 MAG: SPFH domain / Band 7 family protein [Candidatus Moranbacteria bacterium GW2011_GWD1_37_17]KKQ30809.1 MAG: SPFH domain / Band 7 family protein [Candidatus Moranbacteria bacterium GW2011_GWE1_37_24]KKQ47988.1 MAG: SPFH domain / Band 7 family protein [Candidatus Moranbacteria bacte